MAILITDTFTDTDGTNLTSHTGESGTWTAHSASLSSMIISGNKLTKDSGNNQSLVMHSVVVTGDAYVQAPITQMSATAVNAGLAISLDPASDNYVYCRHNQSNNEVSMRSVVAGVASVLGTPVTVTMNPTDTITLRIERRTLGGHDEYRVLSNGAEVIPWVQSDGHAGTRIGIRMSGTSSTTTGYSIDNLEVGGAMRPSFQVQSFRPRMFAPGLAR